jgi:hypothetical protein
MVVGKQALMRFLIYEMLIPAKSLMLCFQGFSHSDSLSWTLSNRGDYVRTFGKLVLVVSQSVKAEPG